jgi:hypothetical protein
MSGHEEQLQRVASLSAERGKARRFLLGICLAFPGMGLLQLTEAGPLRWLVWASMTLGTVLLWSSGSALMLTPPNGSGKRALLGSLPRIALIAGLPERATTVVVSTCFIAGFTGFALGFILHIATT